LHITRLTVVYYYIMYLYNISTPAAVRSRDHYAVTHTAVVVDSNVIVTNDDYRARVKYTVVC